MAETLPARHVPDDPLVGFRLDGRYTLEQVIGEGATGRVYRARQETTGRQVAVKLLREELLRDEASVRRFQREARAACRINHPNAIIVHDFGRSPQGHCFLVTELIEGETLRQRLDRDGPPPPERALWLFCEVLAGVQAAHEQGVVHRDLHPGNIFLCRSPSGEERVKVFDFGGARILDATLDTDVTGVGQLDLRQILMSIRYLSPERLQRDRQPDPRGDVYALGLILFELCTGHYPFQAADPLQVMAMHLREPPPPMHLLAPSRSFSPALQGLVMAMLAKDPLLRPRDAGEVAQRLRAAMERETLIAVHESEMVPEPELEMEMEAMPADESEAETLPIPQTATEPPLQAPVEAGWAGAPDRTLVDLQPVGVAPVRALPPEAPSDPGVRVAQRRPSALWSVTVALLCLLGGAGAVFAGGTLLYRLYLSMQTHHTVPPEPAAREPEPQPLSP